MPASDGPAPAGPEPTGGPAADARSVLFVLGSARRDGNTERLARAAESGLPTGVARRWVRLAEHPLPPFTDLRHEGDGCYPAPDGPGRLLLDATLEATDLVIASPLYWYSLSAATKLYLDHWTAWMRIPGIDFRDRMAAKTLWVVCAYSSDDVVMAEPLLGTLRLCADYFGMRWGGQVLARANRPGGVKPDALAAAAELFRA